MDMVGSMISYSTLQLNLWMEALKTSFIFSKEYQVSRCSKHRMSCGQKEYPHLTTCVCGGSPAEAKVFNPNIGKLYPKTVSCHFIGYTEKSKSFRFPLSRETYKGYGNETRCFPRRWKDEGEHGSSRNWPWSEAGVSAHSNDLWANFLTTCCSCTDSVRYCGASTCCYPTCGNNEWR